ncbi:unnamed protein product, partial [marine sediment metagenome]
IGMMAALMVALIGVTPFTNPGCEQLMVMDAETGEMRPATVEEIEVGLQPVGDAGKAILTATGYPMWIPAVDGVLRLTALILAWYIRPKEQTQVKTAT